MISKVCVTGATGFLGGALVPALAGDGIEVVRFTRDPEAARKPGYAHWDPQAAVIDAGALAGAQAVVHLAGASIATGRWTERRKRLIRDSRVVSTRLLAETLAGLPEPPSVLLTASGADYYGDRGDQAVDEHSPPGEGFLSDVCQQWEAAAEPARAAGLRVVHMRFGLILARHGGALPQIIRPFRFHVGGRIGSGRQHMPWVSLRDAVSAIRFLMRHDSVAGPVNVVAPEPSTNADFTRLLGRFLGRSTRMTVPAFAVRAALGQMGEELLLQGANVRPVALEHAGFRFDTPRLEDAFVEMFKDSERRAAAGV